MLLSPTFALLKKSTCSLLALAALGLVSACDEPPPPPPAPQTSAVKKPPTTIAPDKVADKPSTATSDELLNRTWLGRWPGVEGTFLDISEKNGELEVAVNNLNGTRTFKGKAVKNGIEFERDGVVETLHATDGAGSGMKWFADKKNCLTIRMYEGYCRD